MLKLRSVPSTTTADGSICADTLSSAVATPSYVLRPPHTSTVHSASSSGQTAGSTPAIPEVPLPHATPPPSSMPYPSNVQSTVRLSGHLKYSKAARASQVVLDVPGANMAFDSSLGNIIAGASIQQAKVHALPDHIQPDVVQQCRVLSFTPPALCMPPPPSSSIITSAVQSSSSSAQMPVVTPTISQATLPRLPSPPPPPPPVSTPSNAETQVSRVPQVAQYFSGTNTAVQPSLEDTSAGSSSQQVAIGEMYSQIQPGARQRSVSDVNFSRMDVQPVATYADAVATYALQGKQVQTWTPTVYQLIFTDKGTAVYLPYSIDEDQGKDQTSDSHMHFGIESAHGSNILHGRSLSSTTRDVALSHGDSTPPASTSGAYNNTHEEEELLFRCIPTV